MVIPGVPLCATLVALALLTLLPPAGAAEEKPAIGDWKPRFQGISIARGTWATAAGPQAAVAVRIDLRDPDIRFHATPDNGEAPLETDGETGPQFARRHRVQLAVNTAFFSPCCSYFGSEPKDLAGFYVSQGQIVSPWSSERPAVLAIDRAHRATVLRSAPTDTGDYWFAGAGMDLLKAGRPVVAPNDNRHPRTVAGVSQDNRHLILAVIDGRQPKHSIGASLHEAARWLLSFGGHEGINFDGGGSSILVVQTAAGSGYDILNRPSSGLPRVNGAHLGLFARPLDQ